MSLKQEPEDEGKQPSMQPLVKHHFRKMAVFYNRHDVYF